IGPPFPCGTGPRYTCAVKQATSRSETDWQTRLYGESGQAVGLRFAFARTRRRHDTARTRNASDPGTIDYALASPSRRGARSVSPFRYGVPAIQIRPPTKTMTETKVRAASMLERSAMAGYVFRPEAASVSRFKKGAPASQHRPPTSISAETRPKATDM